MLLLAEVPYEGILSRIHIARSQLHLAPQVYRQRRGITTCAATTESWNLFARCSQSSADNGLTMEICRVGVIVCLHVSEVRGNQSPIGIIMQCHDF